MEQTTKVSRMTMTTHAYQAWITKGVMSYGQKHFGTEK
jgi:hypothetical protein